MDALQFPGLCVGQADDSRQILPAMCRSGYYVMALAGVSAESETMYGRRHYDYHDGALTCRCPGAAYADAPACCLWTVAFHPDLFEGATCEKQAGDYAFFSYAPREALHVSSEERRTLTCCIDDIRRELRHGADDYKRTILCRHIARLLDYTDRFYERQFVTRSQANEAIVRAYETAADRYISAGKWALRGPFTAACCAKELHLSEAYFEELIKHELGHTHHCHMQLLRIEIAKRKLHSSEEPLPRIVRELGFPSIQYFNLLFRKVTGMTPNEYRDMN